eukprot:776991-Pyramimonas_sp.AAC.1
MQGPRRAISKLCERGAANEMGQGWTKGGRMQGYPWEGCPSSLCGLTVCTADTCPDGPGFHDAARTAQPRAISAVGGPQGPST